MSEETKNPTVALFETLDPFTRAYVEAALWTFDDNAPSGIDYSEIHKADLLPLIDFISLLKMRDECCAFQNNNAIALSMAGDASQNGHDLWLSRNRHGCGFFDRDYNKEIDEVLTTKAHELGECNLYYGDDGKIYCNP